MQLNVDEFKSLGSVIIPIKINEKHFKNLTRVRGIYEIDRNILSEINICQSDVLEKSPSVIKFLVEFVIQQSSSVKNDGFLTVCGVLRGPPNLLPVYSAASCHDSNSLVSGSYSQMITVDDDVDNCHGDGGRISLFFDGRANEENFAIFLTEEDKNGIYVHLMWFSCFLMIFLLVVILYATFHRNKEEDWSYQ